MVLNYVKSEQIYISLNLVFVFIPFIVSKDSHQKGLKLKVYKGSLGDRETKRYFYLQYWYNGKARMYKVGNYSQSFGVQECNEALIELHKTHTDPKNGYWVKDPNETRSLEKRIVWGSLSKKQFSVKTIFAS